MKTIIIALTALTGINAYAQPMLSSSCPVAAKVRLPEGGQGFRMARDCKTIYVLPPAAGKISLKGVLPSESLKRCSALRGVMRNLNQISKKITAATSDKPEAPVSTGYDPYGPLNGDIVSTPAESRLSYEELVAELRKKKEIADELLREYGRVEGVEASLLYSTGYGDYLEKARTLNAHLPLTIQALPLKNTKFTFIPANSAGVDFPTVISSSFPSVMTADAMNGSVSGTVKLNLFGACALTGASGTRLSPTVNTKSFSAALPAKLSYEYDLLSTVSYHVSYSKGGLAERIRESSTRGGIFQSKSVSKLINRTRTDSYFTYTEICDEGRACEEDAHDVNIVELKARIMEEVVSNIMLVKFEYPLLPEPAATPGETGAEVGSRELRKCQHKYCQIAAGVLDVASAVMGSSTKTDKFINDERHFVEETVTTSKAYPYTGTMGFAAKE